MTVDPERKWAVVDGEEMPVNMYYSVQYGVDEFGDDVYKVLNLEGKVCKVCYTAESAVFWANQFKRGVGV